MPAARPAIEYVDALERAIDAATRGWTPELVFISAGFDSLRGDPLGGFTLELEHIDRLTRSLVNRAETWCRGRVVSALEGGYAPDAVAAACVVHMRGMV
jgi:acetoin utilization deacetylase AcuC-like enzyme